MERYRRITGENLTRIARYAGLERGDEILPATAGPMAGAPVTGQGGREPEFTEMFAPMWDAHKEAITAYRCITIWGQDMGAGADARARFESHLGAALSCIDHATRSLEEHLQAGSRFLQKSLGFARPRCASMSSVLFWMRRQWRRQFGRVPMA